MEVSPMGDANEDRAKAAQYPHGDLLAILYTQHAQATDLMDQIESSSGPARKTLFEQLTTTLKAHETAEESLVRPVTRETAGQDVAEARNAEEDQANQVIASLSNLDVDSEEFDTQFAEFKQAVSDHAEAEEHDEFPGIESGRTADERRELGTQFLAAFQAAGGVG
jgi:hemerythrin superfamily protein